MEIAPGIYSLHQREGGRVHAFLLDDGHGLTLIDTLYDTDGHRVFDYLRPLLRSLTLGRPWLYGAITASSAWRR